MILFSVLAFNYSSIHFTFTSNLKRNFYVLYGLLDLDFNKRRIPWICVCLCYQYAAWLFSLRGVYLLSPDLFWLRWIKKAATKVIQCKLRREYVINVSSQNVEFFLHFRNFVFVERLRRKLNAFPLFFFLSRNTISLAGFKLNLVTCDMW